MSPKDRPKCPCGLSLLVGWARLPLGYRYSCVCDRLWVRGADGWAEVAELKLSDGRAFPVRGGS